MSDRLYELYGRMISLSAPVIAVVEWAAVGGGAQLAIAADLRFGTSAARFRFPGPGHGLAIGAWALSSLVGRGRAGDLCLTMREVEAEEALAIGLLDRLGEDARDAALNLAGRLAALDADAVARIKHIVVDAAGLNSALAEEREGNREWSGSVARLLALRDRG